MVAAQAPYLIGGFDPNPLVLYSGLAQPGATHLLPGTTNVDLNAGITSQANGHRAALDWLHGHLPWWNPFEGTGNVLAAASVSGAAFFPFILLVALPNGQLLLYLALDLIAAAATYALLLRLGLRPWACFTGAVLFGLNGTNAWFRFGADNPVAFLPVMLLGVEQLRSSVLTGRRQGWSLLTVGVAMSILASFPETAYMDAVLAAVWTLVRTGGMGRARLAFLGRAAVGAVAGALIAAPFLVALADDLAVANVGQHAGDLFAHASLNTPAVLRYFSPYALGPIAGFTGPGSAGTAIGYVWGNAGGYLTAATLVLVTLGLLGARHRPLRISLAVVALILVGRTFGFAPTTDLVNLLPGASNMALYRYADPVVEMAAVVLASLAVDDILRRRPPPRTVLAATSVVALLGILAVRHDHGLDHLLVGPHVVWWWRASLAWAALSVAVVAGAAAARHRLAPAVLVGVLSIEAIAMFVVPELSAPRHPRVDTAVVDFLASRVGTSRFMSFGVLLPNYGAYYGVPSADLDDSPRPEATVRYEQRDLAPDVYAPLRFDVSFDGVSQGVPGPTPLQELPAHLDGYRRIAVAYLVFPRGTSTGDLPAGSVTLVHQDPVADVYRLNGAEPFATAGDRCRVSASTLTTITTDCSGPAQLLRRESMVPGWTADVGGRTVTPSADADGLQVVSVPAGHTVVHYSFTPPHEDLAWVACALGMLALAAGAVPRRAGDRRSARRAGGTIDTS